MTPAAHLNQALCAIVHGLSLTGSSGEMKNGFVGSGGRDLYFFPRAMPVSTVCCFSSGGVSGKAVLSFFLRATPG